MKGKQESNKLGQECQEEGQSIIIIRSDNEREINKEELQTLPNIHNNLLQTVKVVTYKILSHGSTPYQLLLSLVKHYFAWNNLESIFLSKQHQLLSMAAISTHYSATENGDFIKASNTV